MMEYPPRAFRALRKSRVPSTPSIQASGNATATAGFLAGENATDLKTQAIPSRFREWRKKHRAAFSQCWDAILRKCPAPFARKSASCFARNRSVDTFV